MSKLRETWRMVNDISRLQAERTALINEIAKKDRDFDAVMASVQAEREDLPHGQEVQARSEREV